MSKPPRRRPNYDRKLARTITLGNGIKVRTLRDAAHLVGERFGTVTKWDELDRAIELLIAAAESGGQQNIGAATDQLDVVLRARLPD